MMKKTLLVMFTMAFLSTSAIAGTRPEFDLVGADADSIFNCLPEELVLQNSPFNADSDFTSIMDTYKELDPFGLNVIETKVPKEKFYPPADMTMEPEGMCFPGYMSALTAVGKEATYTWRIVLQLDPKSDLDIVIQDCVYRPNSATIWGASAETGAFQTGRAVSWLYENDFYPGRNPSITAMAIPGQHRATSFETPFYLTNRELGNFGESPFLDLLYTSKGIWKESLVAKMPVNQGEGPEGTTEHTLSAGDIIEVTISIPDNSVTDFRYGAKSVGIKYIGESNTQYVATGAEGSTVYVLP